MTTAARSCTAEDLQAWFAGRIPDGWFTEPPEVTVDRDEILVVGRLGPPSASEALDDDQVEVAHRARLSGFREDTREHRMRIADEAEVLWGRKGSWGGAGGGGGGGCTPPAAPVRG